MLLIILLVATVVGAVIGGIIGHKADSDSPRPDLVYSYAFSGAVYGLVSGVIICDAVVILTSLL